MMLVLAVPLLAYVHYVIYLVQIGSPAAILVAFGIVAVPFAVVFVAALASLPIQRARAVRLERKMKIREPSTTMFRMYSWLDLASVISEIPGSTGHARAQPDYSQMMWMTASSTGVRFLAFARTAQVVASYPWSVVRDISLTSLPTRKGVEREVLLLTLEVPAGVHSELQVGLPVVVLRRSLIPRAVVDHHALESLLDEVKSRRPS
ncbi:hypothetical protein [Agreia bicolorata]|uniref:hypothetical protein n=1 Tax=Agreia bicolorata TaxID=110935 RepID=UPI00126A0819|nr:hypothetical protein [Agreia bicolorata]